MSKDKIILALDVSTGTDAVELVKDLKDHVGAFKVGLELFNSTGPRIFESLRGAGAARAAVRMGVWMFNIHAPGGSAMMRAASDAAAEEADRLGIERPLILGVTVLTSISQEVLNHELSVPVLVGNQVTHLAELAQASGLDGVVASPHEIAQIKSSCGPEFLVVTPGVRPAWAAANDQARIMTPAAAVQAGVDYLVIGRAITGASDRKGAALRIIEELDAL